MIKTKWKLFGLVIGVCAAACYGFSVGATSNIIEISAIQASGASASHELIEIKNTSDQDIDMTGWSLVYTAASGVTNKTIVQFTSEADERMVLPRQSREVMLSQELAKVRVPSIKNIITFVSGLNHREGTLTLYTDKKVLVDRVGWGEASLFETHPATSMDTEHALIRHAGDSDDNALDFRTIDPNEIDITYGSFVDVIDTCSNLGGIQDHPPEGYEQQGTVCTPVFRPAHISVSELLPNPVGADTGNEYIELANHEDAIVDLAMYVLKIGDKIYDFPLGAYLEPNGYGVWSDKQLGIVLPNTAGVSAQLVAINGEVIDASPVYSVAPEGETWAHIDGVWQYTNRPTRGGQNTARFDETNEVIDELISACAPGYYRSETTNRCRKIPTVAAQVPCKDGQYRSEETGRCRSIAQAAAKELKPCADDQFRNPATGRCKQIASLDDQPAPCKPGYERNTETGRCRKLAPTIMPSAGFAVAPITAGGQETVGWWVLASFAIAGAGYAAWEWRREALATLRRMVKLFTRR